MLCEYENIIQCTSIEIDNIIYTSIYYNGTSSVVIMPIWFNMDNI